MENTRQAAPNKSFIDASPPAVITRSILPEKLQSLTELAETPLPANPSPLDANPAILAENYNYNAVSFAGDKVERGKLRGMRIYKDTGMRICLRGIAIVGEVYENTLCSQLGLSNVQLLSRTDPIKAR